MKQWDVLVPGFDAFKCEAETASKAKATTYREYIDAGYREEFSNFVRRTRVVRHHDNQPTP